MEFDQLRFFLRVVGLANFTRAAEELAISQPALTRSLRLRKGWARHPSLHLLLVLAKPDPAEGDEKAGAEHEYGSEYGMEPT